MLVNSIPKESPLVIIGAGIAGLAAAHEWQKLHGKQKPFVILEAASCVGGVIRSEQVDGYELEWGPNSILPSASYLMELAKACNLQLRAASAQSKKRYIVRQGKLCALPSGPISFLSSSALSMRGKARILVEPFIRSRSFPEESLAGFFGRRFGTEVSDTIVDSFAAGVFAGSASQIELRAAFPKLFDLEERHGSIIRGLMARKRSSSSSNPATSVARNLYSFDGGLQSLANRLGQTFGSSLHLDCKILSLQVKDRVWEIKVEGLEYSICADNIILAVPAPSAAQLLETVNKELARELEFIQYAPISLMHVGVRTELLPRKLDGFGFLTPYQEKSDLLGALWSSAVFEGKAPMGFELLTCFAGGTRQPHLCALDKHDLQSRMLKSLYAVMGASFEASLVYSRTLKQAIPQYSLGHTDRVKSIAKQLRHMAGIKLAGNYLHGISVENAALSGRQAARELLIRE